jgi:hypothetical protein
VEVRRTQRHPESSGRLDRLLSRAPKSLRHLLGGSATPSDGGSVQLELSARCLGPVLQLSVANPSGVFLSSIDLSLLIEFYDREDRAQEHRSVEFLSPGEEVMLAIPVASEQISRLWCTANYTLRGQRRSVTGGIRLER